MHEMISLSLNASSLQLFTIDGPALRIKRVGEATRWFPIRRLRQVCITGQLRVGLETPFKLAERRIPVSLFTSTGKLRCQLIHPESEAPGLCQLLEESEWDIALQDARNQWFEHTQLQAYAFVGISRGDVKLAHTAYQQKIGQQLNRYKIKPVFEEAERWMQGISQTGISQLLDTKGLPLQGKQRIQLHHQLNKIAWPLIQESSYQWLRKNRNKAADQANLHRALGQLDQQLTPWFARCINHLELALEQASYTPTIDKTR